ncbi:MAG: hypothetical protein DRP87_08390 [Spirochaetes bacterium]|nr:MAG: hypothetical protein DRP87_08390 [Spirochaetota bacterium]
MKGAKTGLIITVFLILYFPTALFTQELSLENLPSWLILEYGKHAFNNGEFGLALEYGRRAIEKEEVYPEADMLIGAVFKEQGESELAIRQYQKAYENRNYLYIPEERFSILYTMAELYEQKKLYSQMENIWKMIVEEDGDFSAPESENLKAAMIRILKEEGLDKMVTLYRLENKFSLEAHSRLGIFYYTNGLNYRALQHLIFNVLTVFSVSIQELRRFNPSYEFADTVEFFQLTLKNERLRSYLISTEFFKNLYYLGTVLYKEGALKEASYIWKLVSDYSLSSYWAERAFREPGNTVY